MFSRWFNSLAGLALALALISFAPQPSFAACQTSGEGAFSAGLEISGTTVTLCGKAIEVQPARSAVVVTTTVSAVSPPTSKPVPKPATPKPAPKAPLKPVASKPVVVLKPIVAAKAPVVLKIIMVDRYVPPPIKVAVRPAPKPTAAPLPKPTPTPTATKRPALLTTTLISVVTAPGATITDTQSISFSPTPMSASVSDSSLQVGQAAIFASDAFTHFRTGTILGRAAEVSFTPSTVNWSFGSGAIASGQTVTRAFSAVGAVTATARVSYLVAYRFVGSDAWVSQGSIAMQAQVQVSIYATGAVQPPTTKSTSNKKSVVLVARNCLEGSGSIGCLSG